MFTNPSVADQIIGLILGLVIPALYIVGIIQYKNALPELLCGE